MPSDADRWLLVVLAALFGGAVGSFLNVVVYRLPHGLSLLSPPSHCPECNIPFRWHDNVPVFGWIALGGRCRDCRCRIPIRYPAVEALVAATFAVVAVFERPLQAAYPFHATLLCTLYGSALIEWDGHRPPPRLFAFAWAVGLAAPLLLPIARPAATCLDLPPWADSAATSLAGLALGAVLAGLAWKASGNGLRLGLISAGLYLGWQGALAVAAATIAMEAVLLPTRFAWKQRRIPASAPLAAAVLAWILFGERLVSACGTW